MSGDETMMSLVWAVLSSHFSRGRGDRGQERCASSQPEVVAGAVLEDTKFQYSVYDELTLSD